MKVHKFEASKKKSQNLMEPQQDKNKIIRDYIDNEITQMHSHFGSDVHQELLTILLNFFTKSITEESARNGINSICGSSVLLEKVKKIRDVSATPLPRQYPTEQGTLRRKRSFPWSEAEDVRLIHAVNQFGPRDWRRIAEFVGGGRNSSQCNQRWCRALDPQIIRSGWTSEEDATLLRVVEVLGRTAWCQVAKVLGGRTDLQCRYRFFQLSKIGKVESEILENKESEDEATFANEPQEEPIPPKRRNSISIAPFTFPEGSPPPLNFHFEMPPYYLESSLRPRQEHSHSTYLHRVPPLLIVRKPFQTTE
ncbi:Myb-like DNA-binding domain containing protein [Tritrichomonas foetus]|uniref:Myb-like DNA-binding domain containing protein n=1 Tax=Tritrichomonas foetus TaxID=1144522 RepID=A0A1J4JFX0_9EUKA|nr:Myb-like DNA-binding domain containing protein [Tritrichomonas foetus]|eukprot:OHS98050.1 Myb-like DNA-binding domain containing protein [Tritrichomonas foetus]